MNPTILVLEDDRVLQHVLCEVLQDEGFDVVAADTLPGLLEVAPSNAQLLITDLLVDQTVVGLSAIQQIRHITHPELPALICSGAQQWADSLRAEIDRLGSRLLAKPFTIDELIHAVHEAIGTRPHPISSTQPAWCA